MADSVEPYYNFPQLPTRLVCEWSGCGLEFLSVELFYEHVSSHAHNLVDKCYWLNCNRKMKAVTPFLLREHLRIHTVQKLYACPNCGHLFSTKIKFVDHFLRHAPLPSFLNSPNVQPDGVIYQGRGEMKICIESYSVTGGKIKVFRCTHRNCDKAFLSSSLLCEHIRSHSSKNQCDECPFVAKTLSRLQSHKLFRHQDFRGYSCSICSKTFKQRGDLRAHVKRHQIVLYKCEKCDFEAHTEEGLSRHSKLHDKNHDYYCHVCTKAFSRGNNLSRHLVSQHNYSLPDGQSKFKYRLIDKGLYLLDFGEGPEISVSNVDIVAGNGYEMDEEPHTDNNLQIEA